MSIPESVLDPVSPPRPGDSYVQSFARGLTVLRSFGAEAPAQTLSGAAARSGVTRAGARRILLTLQELGYVAQEGRMFRLTPKVLELGFAYLGSQPVWHLARPALESLAQAVREPCSAAVLDGSEIVYVLHVLSDRGSADGLGAGSRQPAESTAMGRVLLAGLAEVERQRRLQAVPATAPALDGLPDRAALLDTLERVRREGHAWVHGALQAGRGSIAAPISDRFGRVVAALGVSTDDSRILPEEVSKRLLPRLLEAAGSVNALMRLQD